MSMPRGNNPLLVFIFAVGYFVVVAVIISLFLALGINLGLLIHGGVL